SADNAPVVRARLHEHATRTPMMVGFQALMGECAQVTVEWTCDSADACGFIHAITHHTRTLSSSDTATTITVHDFTLKKRDGTTRRLVHSTLQEVLVPPPRMAMMWPPTGPMPAPTKEERLVGGVRLELFETLFKKS